MDRLVKQHLTFLMMAYDLAETLNQIIFSIIVAILFTIVTHSNSVHYLPKLVLPDYLKCGCQTVHLLF